MILICLFFLIFLIFFQDQFGQHIKSDVHLNFYVYYGPDRIRDPALLSKQDIVLTTYNILTHDYGVSMLRLIFQKLNLRNRFQISNVF